MAKQQGEINDADRKRFQAILSRQSRGLPVSNSERAFAARMRQRIVEHPAANDWNGISAGDRRRYDEIRSRVQGRLPISQEERTFLDKISDQIARNATAPAPPRPPQPAKPPAPPRPPLERSLGGPSGRWWATQTAQRIGITTDQQKKMDDIFQQHRLNLTDLTAALQKEEITLEPLVSAEQPDEAKISAQIDRVAQARAELEKANARMLLGIRRVLTQEQWEKLKSQGAANPGR
jgi:Spy/CpxP family protein refolding chaperone